MSNACNCVLNYTLLFAEVKRLRLKSLVEKRASLNENREYVGDINIGKIKLKTRYQLQKKNCLDTIATQGSKLRKTTKPRQCKEISQMLKPNLVQQNCALDQPDIANTRSIFHVESVTYLTTKWNRWALHIPVRKKVKHKDDRPTCSNYVTIAGSWGVLLLLNV